MRGRITNWEDSRRDQSLGIETQSEVEPLPPTVVGDAEAGFRYTGTPVRLADSIFRVLPAPSGTAFVDMGSGKGRMLALAAVRGFNPVIGIEYSPQLHEIAVKNARAIADSGLRFTPILGDAVDFDFPSEPLAVYFNNPFPEVVMARVLENLTRSYAERPRPIVVAYQQLKREDDPTSNVALLESAPFLRPCPVRLPGFANRFLLAPFAVALFESPEVSLHRTPH